MKNKEVIFLSGNGNHSLGKQILSQLEELIGEKCVFNHINYDTHADTEFSTYIPRWEEIKDKTVVFYQSLHSREFLEEAEDLLYALKYQYGAKYIIGVFPFMLNRRQDPKMEIHPDEFDGKIAKPYEIQRLKHTILRLKNAGVNEMLVATPHSNAMEKYAKEYGILFHEIDASKLFADIAQTLIKDDERALVKVYSPDWGSIERAIKIAKLIDCPVLFNFKERKINGESSIVEAELKDINEKISWAQKEFNFQEIYYATSDMVSGMILIMVEDEIASGKTASETGRLLKKYGVKSLYFFSTHVVLTPGWRGFLIVNSPFTRIFCTNTITRDYKKQTGGELSDISIAPQFASTLFKILN